MQQLFCKTSCDWLKTLEASLRLVAHASYSLRSVYDYTGSVRYDDGISWLSQRKLNMNTDFRRDINIIIGVVLMTENNIITDES